MSDLLKSLPTGCYINGEWRSSSDQSGFDVHDPSTGETIATVASATIDDAIAAVDAADADAIVDPRYVSASFVRGGGGGGEGEGDGAAREGGTASEQPGADSPAAGRGS